MKTYALHNYKKPDDKNTEVTVEKNWQDSDGNTIDGTEENLPPDIGFYLYQVVSTTPFTTPPRSGGAKYIIPEDTRLVDPGETDPESPDYGLYRVSKTDGWTTTFENLPEIRNVDGTTFYYGYYVRELPMEGYTITYTYNGTTRTIVNKEPLPPDNEYIDIGLEKKWVSGDNTAPPAGASATFTVHQQKSERSEAQGTIPVRIVDDNDTEVFSIMASEDDVLDLEFAASLGAGTQISILTGTGWTVKNWWVSRSGAFSYTVNENDIVDGSITFKLDTPDFVNQCTEGPYFTNTASTGSSSTYSDYADTSWTREITLPTTAGNWSTTIRNLIQEDADGNLYRYYITKDASTPTASNISFKDDLGKDIEHAINTPDQVVEVTNTYETFEFSKIWKDTGGQPTAWPAGATITVTLNAYTDTKQKAIDDVQVTLSAQGSAPGVTPKWTATANADGTITSFKVAGLPKDKDGEVLHYYVIEEQVSGYKAPSYATADGNGLVFTGNEVPKATNGQQIINTPEDGAELPSTGGPGTGFFAILGSILIAGAGLLLWRRRRNAV